MPDPSTTHPDLADLEAARTGEAPADVEAHVRACEECRRIVAERATCAGALARAPTLSVRRQRRSRRRRARRRARGARRRRARETFVRALIALFLVLGASGASVAADGAGRFRTVAVYVDAGQAPLAAYQVEITVGDTAPTAKIVGVEGGSADAFRAAPYYDPAALQGGRIIIAAFTTEA